MIGKTCMKSSTLPWRQISNFGSSEQGGGAPFFLIANRSGMDDRSAIFRKIIFPLLSRRILTKSMKHNEKNKGSPLARRSQYWKFVATEELSFSCMFCQSYGSRQQNIDKIKNMLRFCALVFGDFIDVLCLVEQSKTLRIHR